MEITDIDLAFYSIGFGLLGVLIGVFIGHLLNIGRERRSIKRHYKSFISDMIRHINTVSIGDIEFNRNLLRVDEIRGETIKIREILRPNRIKKIDGLISSYESISVDRWAGPDTQRQRERNNHNEEAHNNILSNLESIYKLL